VTLGAAGNKALWPVAQISISRFEQIDRLLANAADYEESLCAVAHRPPTSGRLYEGPSGRCPPLVQNAKFLPIGQEGVRGVVVFEDRRKWRFGQQRQYGAPLRGRRLKPAWGYWL